MFNLAGFRYRSAFVSEGGPIDRIEVIELPIFGRRLFQANATLIPGLVPCRELEMYSGANGTGAHVSPMIARYIAVSEALERWAFHATVRSECRAKYGFDIDESSTGLAAFPSWRRRDARRLAALEAYERFCLLNWWEGRIQGQLYDTEWAGISALVFEPSNGGVSVLLFGRSNLGFYVYGHDAAESFKNACERAVVELVRHERVVRHRWLVIQLGNQVPLADRFERRAWFFSTNDGHKLFRERLASRVTGPPPKPEVICDAEIEGLWSRFATVWRFAFRPPTQEFLSKTERYFYW